MAVQRLGLNHHGYAGEPIDSEAVLREIRDAALARGWRTHELPVEAGPGLLALTRSSADSLARRFYISSGIHGDEPAGPLAVRQLVLDDEWPANSELWLCPCLNPMGFQLRQRENPLKLDLNRQYRHLVAVETRAHIAWLERQPSFEVAICLHEDWESQGFYLYELNPDGRPSHAEEVIRRVAEVCPIDRSPVIEGREAQEGVVRPSTDPASRTDWPEAFWLLTHKTRHCYTVEAPSDFPLPTRVGALVTATKAILGLPAPTGGVGE